MIFNLQYITDYIDKKIEKNENLIIIKFHELRVKENLSEEQIKYFLEKSKIRLVNVGYKIYEEGNTYKIGEESHLVESNVYYVAIKEK